MSNSLSSLLPLLKTSYSAFHVVDNMKNAFLEHGFIELHENETFNLEQGKSYFVTRNESSIIAFHVPAKPKFGYRIAATHNDSPTFVLKPNPVLDKGVVTMLNTEPYGGGIYYSWMDRPLSFAGRVYTEEDGKIVSHHVCLNEDALVIPSLAIHMNRGVNDGAAINPAKETIPLWLDGSFKGDFNEYLAKKFDLKGKVLSFDLSLYVREEPKLVGGDSKFLLSPRLDDLASSYSSLLAFVDAKKEEGYISIFASFDNEEVGSLTQQGAAADFLKLIVRRIGDALFWSDEEKAIAQANAILLSVDNAHANHPNYPEMSDATTHVKMNGGIVIKYNANQHYTTNGHSSAYVKKLCNDLGQPYQEFTNRSDLRGGSTLGNLSNAEISFLSADIGIAQLAMHSAVELCGVDDIDAMVALLKAHYLGE